MLALVISLENVQNKAWRRVKLGSGLAYLRLALVACAAGLTNFGSTTLLAQNITTTGISFSNLTGTNMAPFLGYSEGGFAVTPSTPTNWFQSRIYGTPAPSIFDGPVGSPHQATIQITDGAGLFTFKGFDFSSNNGDSGYIIDGRLGSASVFFESGTLSASTTPFGFSTLFTLDPSAQVDAVVIQVTPGDGVTSINLDNILVTTVPEPDSLALLGLALVVWNRFRSMGRGTPIAR